MITDDEVMRLFERADPARVDDGASVIDAAGYLDTLRTRSSNVTLIDIEATPSRPPNRHRWWIVTAAAAAAVLVVGVVLLAIRDDETEPATDEAPVPTPGAVAETTNEAAQEIAQGFAEAYGALDVDRAITYLADDADITGLIDSWTTEEVHGTVDELRLLTSLLEAMSFRQTLDSCDELSSSATDTTVRCAFEFQSLRSDELGLGPFDDDSYFDLTVRDGTIVHASLGPSSAQFTSQVWSPFAEWMEANHPQDAAAMYDSPNAGGIRLAEEAAPLWEQNTQDYVQVVLTRRAAYAAEVGTICATQAAGLGELAAPADGTPDQLAVWNEAAAAILDQAHRQLIAPEMPPSTDTTAYSIFYYQLARLAHIAEDSAEAATGGDSTRLAELDTEYGEVRQAMSSGPAGSSLKECLDSLPR